MEHARIQRKVFYHQTLLTVAGIAFLFAIFSGMWGWLLASFAVGRLTSWFCAQICLHRYFSHKNFQVSPTIHKVLVLASILAGQGSPVMWAAQHRHHHKHTDTELDTHSPREGKWLAFGFWMWLGYDWFFVKKKMRTIPVDLLRDPLIKWVDKWYYAIWAAIIAVSAVLSWKFCVFIVLSPLVWGFMNMGLITLATHLKLPGSYKNYERNDDSYNNKLINVYLMGDALHNNHHEKPNECNEAHREGELDIAYLFIKRFLSS